METVFIEMEIRYLTGSISSVGASSIFGLNRGANLVSPSVW